MKWDLIPMLAVATAIAATGAMADDYPSQNVDVIVPYAAGGGTDTGARLLVPALEKVLGQRFLIQNLPGAGGTVGATEFARKSPDGYTLGYLPVGTTTTQPHLRKLAYDADSWAPVCLTIQDPMAVAVAPDSRFESLDDIIAAAEAGESVTTGGPSPGSLPHIAQAAVANAYDVEFKYVPFDGGASTGKAILGGQVDIIADPIGSTVNYGLKPLVVLDAERHPLFPDVPTIDEIGGDPLRYSIWFGLFAVAGTPPEIVQKLSDACGEATSTEEYRQSVTEANRTPRFMASPEFTEFFHAQYDGNAELLSVLGLSSN